jgi:hypothetical protein
MFKSVFVSFWDAFEDLIQSGVVISVKEVFRELERRDDELHEWSKIKRDMFLAPIAEEALFIQQIFAIPHFQGLLQKAKIYEGGLNADPFVIAKAKVIKGTVVTTEKFKPNASKIPNVCKHFDIPCIGFEQFMQAQDWKY